MTTTTSATLTTKKITQELYYHDARIINTARVRNHDAHLPTVLKLLKFDETNSPRDY